jgi:hypothetical protein
MSDFPYITNHVLVSNLEYTQSNISNLLLISESQSYRNEPVFLGGLRKTIIIYLASIIEALLVWRLSEFLKTKNFNLSDEWKYYNIKLIHKIDDGKQVIAGFRKSTPRQPEKLDFVRVIDLSFKHKVIKSEKLKADIHKVRKLRNRLHIGNLPEKEKEYTKEDLEFCFKVVQKVKVTVSK